MADHGAHGRWEQIGDCVWCPCGVRLYLGEVPDEETDQSEFAGALVAILDAASRWHAAAHNDGTREE